MTRRLLSTLAAVLALPLCSHAQSAAPDGPPAANPSRPTVTNPATLPPTGYLQFEQGYLGSVGSPATADQFGINQVTKIAVHSRVLLQAQFQPWAASRAQGDTAYTHGFGDVLLGIQGVLYTPHTEAESSPVTSRTDAKDATSAPAAPQPKKTPVPTISLGYLGRVHTGTTGDIDLGSYSKSLLLLLSGDFGDWHYDTNYIVNEQSDGPVRRAQFAQTLSVNHPLSKNSSLAVELYHFTQPLVSSDAHGRMVARANLVDVLVAPSYTLRPNLVLDGGFSHGLTSTSTRWQSFAGFTYLLPHRLWPEHKS